MEKMKQMLEKFESDPMNRASNKDAPITPLKTRNGAKHSLTHTAMSHAFMKALGGKNK